MTGTTGRRSHQHGRSKREVPKNIPPSFPFSQKASVRRSLVQTKSGWWGRPRVVWYIGRIGALCCPCQSSFVSLSRVYLMPRSNRPRCGDTSFVHLSSSSATSSTSTDKAFVTTTQVQAIPASFLSLNVISDVVFL